MGDGTGDGVIQTKDMLERVKQKIRKDERVGQGRGRRCGDGLKASGVRHLVVRFWYNDFYTLSLRQKSPSNH